MHFWKPSVFLFTLFAIRTYADEKVASYLFAGSSYAHVNFRPDGHTSFNGNLGGAQISYEYRPDNRIYEGVKLAWKQGEIYGKRAKRHLLDFNTQARIGYTFALWCNKLLLTPFTGLGWRYFSHNLKQHKQSSLHFYYNEIYIPVGLLTDYKINTSFSLGFYATWMPQIFPSVNVKPIGNARWVLERTFANILIEVPLTYFLTKQKTIWSLNLKPFFEYWQDGKTLAKTTSKIALDLPSNTYKFLGVELNVGCSF